MEYTPPIGGDPGDPYIDKNPSQGIAGSKVPAQAIEDPQRELDNLITKRGLTPSADDNTQVWQALLRSMLVRDAVRVVATTNLTLSGEQTISGVACVAGDEVLAAGQTDAKENGVWIVVAGGAWTRRTDMDASNKFLKRMQIPVSEGDNAGTVWWLTNTGAITLGTTELVFESIREKEIKTFTATVAGGALTITVPPQVIDFRDQTLGDGSVDSIYIAAPISTVISSGSTGGGRDGVSERYMVLLINNGGTVEVAWINARGGIDLDESKLISTVAEGGVGGADNKSTIYSTAARSNVPFRVYGFFEATEATAGTWTTPPSKTQGAGGNVRPASLLSFASVAKTTQSIPASTPTKVTFDTYNDTDGLFDVANNKFIAPAACDVIVSINGSWGGDNSGYRRQMVYLNGANQFEDMTPVDGQNLSLPKAIAQVVRLAAGQYLELFVFHNAASSINYISRSFSVRVLKWL
ncbi:MAG: hypothetical protein OEV73_00040 [Desulfobulbaceae bacterium]|nr:hypothetical protein [Desulfobulbaceae bacterium]